VRRYNRFGGGTGNPSPTVGKSGCGPSGTPVPTMNCRRYECRIGLQAAAAPCLSRWERWLAVRRDGEGLHLPANYGILSFFHCLCPLSQKSKIFASSPGGGAKRGAVEKLVADRRGRRSLQCFFGVRWSGPSGTPVPTVFFRGCGGADRRGRRSLQCFFVGAVERTVGDAGPYNVFSWVRGNL